jgi:hypothetical protein
MKPPPVVVWVIAFVGFTALAEGAGGWGNLALILVVVLIIGVALQSQADRRKAARLLGRATPGLAKPAAKPREAGRIKSSVSNRIHNRDDLRRHIAAAGGGPHYVYVLRTPDAEETPFYVGVGVGDRLFAHEKEARDRSRTSPKVEKIRAIWASGLEVVRTIDSVHASEPWRREEQLINELGRVADGTGSLLNAQSYSPSAKIHGVELRKYAAEHQDTQDPFAIPKKFKYRDAKLFAGPNEPSPRTVFGKIHAVVKDNPGVTGEELIHLLRNVDFSTNKSAYTQSGQVSATWLARYIEGAFRADQQFLQVDSPA